MGLNCGRWAWGGGGGGGGDDDDGGGDGDDDGGGDDDDDDDDDEPLQVAFLLQDIEQSLRRLPLILAGDLNSLPESAV